MYERFYRLTARPFQLMPDPRRLFESRDHVRALSYLLYGLERREGFVVVTGDVGTGKTLLLQSLLLELDGRNLDIARVAMANMGAESVVPAVAAAFGLPYRDRSKLELLDALVGRLQTHRGQGALLIVDEAQTCSVEALEELRVIGNLQAGGQALMQIALVGQTELRDLLALPGMSHLRQRVVAAHHLRPLALDETRGYIEHRLRSVDWQNDPAIDPEVYPRIHEWTEGVPRRINMLMDRVLLFGYLEELHRLTTIELNTVIEEFEQELGANPMVWKEGAGPDVGPATSGAAVDAPRLDALHERLRSMEQTLRNAVGERRMAELLTAHRADMDNAAIVQAERRLVCLERVLDEIGPELRTAPVADPYELESAPAATESDPVTGQGDQPDARVASAQDKPEPPAIDSDDDWLEDFEIRPSRLFFWRKRDRDR